MLQAVYNASQMMAFLMDDLLDFQLIEHGKFKPKLEFFSIAPAVREVIETL
jgi:signal transduction histidine kinase